MSGDSRESVRGSGRVVVEVEGGITVYPPQRDGEPWRAVFTENGRRRYREAGTEDKLAAKLAKVTERLQADAPHLERPGADLIGWYLCPDRHPAGRPWSRKHADTQRRLCARFAAPVIAAVPCPDIRVADMQQIVNAAPTAGEGARLHRCLSAMVTAGITAGYLVNPRLREVHWQVGERVRETFPHSVLRQNRGGAQLRGQRKHVAALHPRAVPSYRLGEQLQVGSTSARCSAGSTPTRPKCWPAGPTSPVPRSRPGRAPPASA